MYRFDSTLAAAGKGIIKTELSMTPAYFTKPGNHKTGYDMEKNRIADQVITLLEKQYPGLRKDIEVIDVTTLNTWERFMGGIRGLTTFPINMNWPVYGRLSTLYLDRTGFLPSRD